MPHSSTVRFVPRLVGLALALAVTGCNSGAPAPGSQAAQMQLAASPKPATPQRPTIAPPAFKVFHHDANSVTLVTKDNASEDEIAALIWQLRDAAHTHTFDKLGIPQKLVDARDPMIWFHIYRGSKCASEKYTTGKLPCDAAYHAAGDYTLGGFTNKDHDDGVVLKDEDHQTELWNPDAPYKP